MVCLCGEIILCFPDFLRRAAKANDHRLWSTPHPQEERLSPFPQLVLSGGAYPTFQLAYQSCKLVEKQNRSESRRPNREVCRRAGGSSPWPSQRNSSAHPGAATPVGCSSRMLGRPGRLFPGVWSLPPMAWRT